MDGEKIERRFAALVADAQRQYLEKAGEGQRNFVDPPLPSTNALLQRVRQQNEQFDNFRDKERKLIDVVGEILKPVQSLGGLVADVAGEMFGPTQHIYAAVTFLIGSANNVSAYYDAILDLFVQLKDFTIRLEFYLTEEMSDRLREKVVEILAVLFEILLIATEEINRGRVRAYFRSVFQRDSKIPGAMHRLQQLVKGEEGLVMAETLVSIKRAVSLAHHMREEMEQMRAETREQTALTNRQRLRAVLEPSVHPADRFHYLEKHRTKGTGEWLVSDDTFLGWVEAQYQFLWIRGNPGTGKSYLASKMISWIGEKRLARPAGADPCPDSLAYFFFQETKPETRSVLQALRDMAFQLSEDDAFYSKELLRNLGSKDDVKTIWNAFRRIVDGPSTTDTRNRHVYLVLDGIDEADREDVQELLSLFNDLPHSTRSTKFQVALLGRDDVAEAVTSTLDPDMVQDQLRTLHLTQDRVKDDVQTFIVEQIRKSYSLRRVGPAFKEQVVSLLVDKVDGLFILANLMLQDVGRNTHRDSILKSLESFPKEVDGMLYETLRRMSTSLRDGQVEDLNEILQWVACAEQPLTLEQVETALALKFGDPPIGLEETLRTQYSCFFSVDREDGLSTADFYQPAVADQKRALSPGGSNGSPSQSRSRSPGKRDGASGSPDPFSPLHGIDFNSPKQTTKITFQHASVSEFFRDDKSTDVRATPTGPAIGFDLSEAQLHVLKQCLAVLTRKEGLKAGAGPLWEYATWYWQEHLVAVDRAKVAAEDKKDIGRSLHMLITKRKNILDWTKEEESLKLFTDTNMDCLREWMSDEDVVSGLNDEAKAWALQAVKTKTGLVEPIGRLYARAWLDPGFGEYIMTMTCFEIVHSVAYIEAGHSWTESDSEWGGIPARKRMRTALAWANIPKSAHWSRRVGSTYVNLGLQTEALKHFNDALPLDGNIVETCGRIAFCYMTTHQYEKALIRNLMCEFLEENLIARGAFTTPREKDFSRWRLYTNQRQIAQCYRKLDKLDKALVYYHKAMQHTYEKDKFEPEAEYLDALAANNKHKLIMGLLTSMGRQQGKEKGSSRLVDFLVDQASNVTSLEWMIPKTASKTGKSEFMTKRYLEAIEEATRLQDAAKHLYLRLSLASLHYYSRDYEAAIAIYHDISQGASQRGSVLVRTLNTMSLRSWAAVYKHMIVRAGPRTAEADELMGRLETLRERQRQHRHKDMPPKLVGIDVNDASLYLGLFHHQRGDGRAARELLGPIIVDSLRILDDGEPQNDAHGLENLSRALVAIGDMENARALFQSTRRPADDVVRLSTLADAALGPPVGDAGGNHLEVAPLLPYALAHPWVCFQCLDTIMINDDVVVCTRCLDTYCTTCMEKFIRVDGNSTADRRCDIVCRNDHDWFVVPPLHRKLNRGQVLMPSGDIVKLSAWQDSLRAQWTNVARY